MSVKRKVTVPEGRGWELGTGGRLEVIPSFSLGTHYGESKVVCRVTLGGILPLLVIVVWLVLGYDSGMPEHEITGESQESMLCKSCGLCCTGHLFSWVRLNASELDHSEELGLNVIRSDPRQRGFTQPCPVWDGVCTVHTSPHYPRGCRSYQCRLLRQMIDGDIRLPESLLVIQQALAMIREVEALLPASPNVSFRERLVAQMEQGSTDPGFQLKANALLAFFELHFGVNDFLGKPMDVSAGR